MPERASGRGGGYCSCRCIDGATPGVRDVTVHVIKSMHPTLLRSLDRTNPRHTFVQRSKRARSLGVGQMVYVPLKTRNYLPLFRLSAQIAAIACVNDLILVTSNKADFEDFKGLHVGSRA